MKAKYPSQFPLTTGVVMARTNITVNDSELWRWAKKRAIDLELKGVSEYLFLLIERDKRYSILNDQYRED